jgi:hypothetical protein
MSGRAEMAYLSEYSTIPFLTEAQIIREEFLLRNVTETADRGPAGAGVRTAAAFWQAFTPTIGRGGHAVFQRQVDRMRPPSRLTRLLGM